MTKKRSKQKTTKRRNRGAKGGQFEREICTALSLWWTKGARDDVFWRSSASGARATFRRRRSNKTTFGQSGDVAAIDPIGSPLLQLFTIEIKRGYNSETIADLIDRKPKAAQQKWEEWIQQAWEAHKCERSHAWMIINRRDQRDPIVAISREISRLLRRNKKDLRVVSTVKVGVRFKYKEGTSTRYTIRRIAFDIWSLKDFEEQVTPEEIKKLVKVLS